MISRKKKHHRPRPYFQWRSNRYPTGIERYSAVADQIAPFVADAALLPTAPSATRPERGMFEGAQGTILDIDHGTYPFVTSSSATSGGASIGTGVPPTSITTVIGVTKAWLHPRRRGPVALGASRRARRGCPQEGQNEYGALTGKAGWIDLPLLRYSNMIKNSTPPGWSCTKLRCPRRAGPFWLQNRWQAGSRKSRHRIRATAKSSPSSSRSPGWRQSTLGIAKQPTSFHPKAQTYLRFLQQESGAAIGMVSAGRDRNRTVFVDEFSAFLTGR